MKNSFWLFGAKFSIVESVELAYDLIEGLFPPGSGTPMHVHSRYSETVYVLEGEVTVYTQDSVLSLYAGESHFIPKNTPHAIVNDSATAAFTILTIAAPGGIAKLIRSVGAEGKINQNSNGRPRDMKLLMKLLEEMGDLIIGELPLRILNIQ